MKSIASADKDCYDAAARVVGAEEQVSASYKSGKTIYVQCVVYS